MLQRGDRVPHFDVTDVRCGEVRYQTLWQRRNLVLVSVPPERSAAVDAYVTRLAARVHELAQHETELVVTRDPVSGLPSPGLAIADRWGEVVHAVSGDDIANLPDANDIVEWLRYVQMRCPECEGEAR